MLIHLAWLFQPTHNPVTTWRANVEGSIRFSTQRLLAATREVRGAFNLAAEPVIDAAQLAKLWSKRPRPRRG